MKTADLVNRVAARLPRTEVLLLWLLAAHVVLKLLIYPLTMHAAPYNDEQQYYDGARALSNCVRDVFAFSRPTVPSSTATWSARGGSCRAWRS